MVILVGFCLILAYLLYEVTKRPDNFPTGPFNLPIFGYLPFLGAESFKTFTNLSKKYGDVFSVNWGPFRRLLVLNSYSAIKEAFKEEAFAARPDTYFFHVRGDHYHGVIFNQGPGWAKVRRYALKVLRDFGLGKSVLENAVANEVADLISTLKKEVGTPLQLHGRFNVAVLNALWTITTGERISLDNVYMNSMLKRLRRLITGLSFSGLVQLVPYNKYIPVRLLGARAFFSQISKLKDIVQQEISRQLNSYTEDGQTDNIIKTFLEKIATTNQSGEVESAFYGQEGMKNLTHLVMDFFVAGSETVSSTLIWMFLFLAKNPEIQERVHQELDRVVGRSRLPNLNDKPQLPFTEAVVMETHRCASVTPLGVSHGVLYDTEFRGFKIPKGTTVVANIYAVHHDPETWEKPDEFYPEHFLDNEGRLKQVEQLIPFLIGKRSCLGEGLARMEVVLFATHLLHTFKWTLPQKEPRASAEGSNSLLRALPSFEVILSLR